MRRGDRVRVWTRSPGQQSRSALDWAGRRSWLPVGGSALQPAHPVEPGRFVHDHGLAEHRAAGVGRVAQHAPHHTVVPAVCRCGTCCSVSQRVRSAMEAPSSA
jgi:hypothetical protein